MRLSGSITALATPFAAAGEIDFSAWRHLLDQQIAAGSGGVVVAGSTGEAAALSEEEFTLLLRETVERVGGRLPVLAGTGLSNTVKTIALTRLARDCGADAALVVTPPYVRPTQAGLIAHYTAVAEQGGLPVVLYNVPSRTGCDLLPETVAELRDHPNIVGLKEAVGELSRWSALYPLRSAGFSLLSGDDPTCCRALCEGADGVISVASNLVPRTFARLCALIAAGDRQKAVELDGRLQDLYDFLGVEPNPIPVKAALQRLGFGHGLRLPLLSLSAAYAGQTEAMVGLCRRIESEFKDEP